MTWHSAQLEAANRIARLPLPPEPASLAGLTVTLIDFETDELAGFLVGGNSREFQKLVNRAIERALKKRGAVIIIEKRRLRDVLVWPPWKSEDYEATSRVCGSVNLGST